VRPQQRAVEFSRVTETPFRCLILPSNLEQKMGRNVAVNSMEADNAPIQSFIDFVVKKVTSSP
jgi:hypothetical protein